MNLGTEVLPSLSINTASGLLLKMKWVIYMHTRSSTTNSNPCKDLNLDLLSFFLFSSFRFFSFPLLVIFSLLSEDHYLDFLVDLDFFILCDLSSTLLHLYPLGIAKGSDSCAPEAEHRCCCCLLADADWLLFRLNHIDDDDEEEDGKDV